MAKKDEFTRAWITENAIEIIAEYDLGELTIRGLHYRLVARGMTNTLRHYKRVVGAMIKARWEGQVQFEAFSDHDRGIIGSTPYEETIVEDEIEYAKGQVGAWLRSYSKNRWENQKNYVEVFIEKKALQGVFGKVCDENEVALGACKGYPSLTFLNDTADRMRRAKRHGKNLVILYFGDYDPSGEDIPRSIKENLWNMGLGYIDLIRCALMKEQVEEWGLPPAPAKVGDSRTASWDGLGQVELDAVEPNKLRELCQEAIDEYFDYDDHERLLEIESSERETYRETLKDWINNEMED